MIGVYTRNPGIAKVNVVSALDFYYLCTLLGLAEKSRSDLAVVSRYP